MNKFKLSSSEISVLKLAAKGKNNKEIAKELYISSHTVKARISAILRKLSAIDRTNATYIATQNGII